MKKIIYFDTLDLNKKEDFDKLYSDDYVILIATKKLFKNSMQPNLYNAHLFIRYYVVKCYLTKTATDQAFALYNETQQKRVAFKSAIPKDKANNQEVFINLIKSMQKNQFIYDYPILINKKIKLFNGSHRLAIALYLNIPYVPIKIDKQYEDIDAKYSVDFFISNNMSKQVDIIYNMLNELNSTTFKNDKIDF